MLNKTMSPLVYLFATVKEAQAWLDLLSAKLLRQQPFPLYSAEIFYSLRPIWIGITGMGPQSTLAACHDLLATAVPCCIVNAGVAGALTDWLPLGEVVVVERAVLQQEDDLLGEWVELFSYPLSGYKQGRLLTVHHPVDDTPRRQACSLIADVVDMEGAVVASFCQQRAIPCVMIKAISDMADEQAKINIQANLFFLAARLASTLQLHLVDLVDYPWP